MILASLSYSISAAAVKYLKYMPLSEKIFFRNLVGSIFIFLIARKGHISLKVNNGKILALRCVTGLTGLSLYYCSLNLIKFSDAVILNKFAPLLVVFFSMVLFNDKVTKSKVIAIIINVIGAIFVIKPSGDGTLLPHMVALASALFDAMALTAVSYLRKFENPETIVFYYSAFTVIICLPFAFFGLWVIPKDLIQWIMVLTLALFATLGQLFMTHSYQHANASDVSIYLYGDIIFSTIFSVMFFKESLDIFTILGGILIILAGYINFASKSDSSNF